MMSLAMDPVDTLREEFEARRQAGLERTAARVRRDRRNATIAGGFTGLVAVAVTAGVTRRALFWHSFVLESCLCALAGYLLVRGGGGPMRGMVLFSSAYLAAWLLRALGLDPSVLFALGDVSGAAMITGNVTSLVVALSCGLLVGLTIESG
jgi:hypothetical protein